MVLTQSNMLPLGTELPNISLNNCKGSRYIQPQEDKLGFVVAFICNHCPYVINIKEVMSAILNKAVILNFEVVAINSNDWRSYPDDSPENMIIDAEKYNYNFPYLIDETQEVAKTYDAVCTPDFFGYNSNLELQYRGRIRELKELKPVRGGESDLLKAMRLIGKTGKGPKNQIPSMGCNIKWLNN